jgi:hypothetical protein
VTTTACDQQVAAQKRRLEACAKIKNTLQRTARNSPDVVFLSLAVPDDATKVLHYHLLRNQQHYLHLLPPLWLLTAFLSGILRPAFWPCAKEDGKEAQQLMDKLEVQLLPTITYFKAGGGAE